MGEQLTHKEEALMDNLRPFRPWTEEWALGPQSHTLFTLGPALWAFAFLVNCNYLQNKPHFVWDSSVLRVLYMSVAGVS